jgi:hypothetical protein
VGDRQVDAALHPVGQVHPQPAGDARRQGGENDLVEPLAAEDVPDGPQGMTAMEWGPRWTEPVTTSSAGISRWTGNLERSWRSRAAGSIRMPAPPAPRKKRFSAPCRRLVAIASWMPWASAMAPDWIPRKRSSSKFSIAPPAALYVGSDGHIYRVTI